MRVAIYARVSTEAQEARGTIGSQVATLRERVTAEGHELIAEFCDDGHSGARLDRPGLDALRDGAEVGLFEAVWCLSPDRLARVYAYQVIVLDELARHSVAVRFADAPAIDDDDPQARLLTQVQGVIAEYERAKIAERYRRGKLWRSRAGEVLAWKAPYGYRRMTRTATSPAHLEIYEPEAAVVRRIFADYVAGGHSTREITRRLNADRVPTPTGKRAVWGTSTIGRLLRNEAYVGRAYWNKTESVPDPRPGRANRQIPRPRQEWIEIPAPPIISDDIFEAASRVSRDNSKWSPRNAEPGAWLLRSLVRCGACGVGVSCHKMRGRDGTMHRYYYCHNHDPLRAGGEDRRCRERNIRSDELDSFVFDQICDALRRPDVLLAGEQAVTTRTPAPDDELLAAQLARLDRKTEAADSERRRLADLYQAGLIELIELQRRAHELDDRRSALLKQRHELADQRAELATGNRLRRRLTAFADTASAALDELDFEQRQKLLRLIVDEVRVTGWNVEIRLRIPLDQHDHSGTDSPPVTRPRQRASHHRTTKEPVSSNDRLRSLGEHRRRVLPHAHPPGPRRRHPQGGRTMNTPRPLLVCPTCGRPHPGPASSTEPHYCSIACYRAGHHLDDPVTGDGRRWCPGCSRYLDTDGQRCCSAACRVADWRRRQPRSPIITTRRPATIGATTLTELISEHAPAPYTGDDSAAVLDEAITTLGTLRRLQHVGDAGATLHLLASLAAHIDTLIPATIHAARDQDYTWTEIAALTNLSRDRVQRLAAQHTNHRSTPPDND